MNCLAPSVPLGIAISSHTQTLFFSEALSAWAKPSDPPAPASPGPTQLSSASGRKLLQCRPRPTVGVTPTLYRHMTIIKAIITKKVPQFLIVVVIVITMILSDILPCPILAVLSNFVRRAFLIGDFGSTSSRYISSSAALETTLDLMEVS
ncbi:hypothetical protein EDB85DRAFT_2160749 [Lactarius pseudohatsudake]|nr:hypothetical protein EDB85DRAFT_2160749 [Lactarius pseudohatsudake]